MRLMFVCNALIFSIVVVVFMASGFLWGVVVSFMMFIIVFGCGKIVWRGNYLIVSVINDRWRVDKRDIACAG